MPSSEQTELTWTTWEELLLACAVKRHGIKDWDSVAMELQTRSSLSLLLTSQVCRNKYHDLQRRFTEPDDDDQTDTIPWLEELRKLRVSELKQELHRYDLSIQTLQLKVKSLEEERERSLKENDDVEPDLENNLEKERSENDKDDDGDAGRAPEESTPTSAAGRENRSFNESSSTANRKEPEPVGTSEFKPDPVQSESKSASEDSCNDSSNTVAKHAAAAAAKVSQEEKKGGESTGLRDSVGDSKEGVKESSDVQSTASLTRKRRREKEVSGVVSPATIKRGGEKSEPLVGLLDIIIRSHKHGSLFESRLESQKKDEYKNTVRTHLDLATIRTRLKNGSYSSCTTKFYRDLLLLFTNAIVFFPKASMESATALELRNLVLDELKKKKPTQGSDSSSPDQAPSNPTSVGTKLKPVSLLAKHKSSVPILVCRKRSSISAKTSNTKQTDEKKPNLNPNAPAKNLSNLKEEESPKTNERPVTGTRSTRRNKEEDKGESRMRNDKKKSDVAAVKKRGAADFLRRIKRNSPSKGTTVVETLKSGGGEGNSGGGRRENSKRGEGRKEAPLQRPGSGGGKPRKEESSPLKRGGGGRPAKKGTEGGGRRKRGREDGGAEVGSKQTRKRSRR